MRIAMGMLRWVRDLCSVCSACRARFSGHGGGRICENTLELGELGQTFQLEAGQRVVRESFLASVTFLSRDRHTHTQFFRCVIAIISTYQYPGLVSRCPSHHHDPLHEGHSSSSRSPRFVTCHFRIERDVVAHGQSAGFSRDGRALFRGWGVTSDLHDGETWAVGYTGTVRYGPSFEGRGYVRWSRGEGCAIVWTGCVGWLGLRGGAGI